MKYKLPDKKTNPEFDYILVTGDCFNEYYLFRAEEFEEAYEQLKIEYAKGNRLALLCDKDFNTISREWRAKPVFRRYHNKVIYDAFQEVMLHLKWYCDAGEWKNPREEWIKD